MKVVSGQKILGQLFLICKKPRCNATLGEKKVFLILQLNIIILEKFFNEESEWLK